MGLCIKNTDGISKDSIQALFCLLCLSMFYYAPLVVFIAILALLFFYKLDREYDGIMKVLDERHKKQEEAAA